MTDTPEAVLRYVGKIRVERLERMGYVIVPVKPTTEMLRAYIISKGYDPDEPADTLDKALLGISVVDDYRAMIEAGRIRSDRE